MPLLDMEAPAEPEVSEEEIQAGKDFAAAVKSGDGLKVIETYKAMKTLCEAAEAGGGEY